MRRFVRLGSVVVVGALTALTSGGTASAAPLPASYSADAGAQVLGLTETGSFLGIPLPFANVSVAESAATADSTATPRTEAAGSNLFVKTPIVGLTVNQISQTAPPSHPAPTTATFADINAAGLSATVLRTSVQARWAGDRTCPAAGMPLSTTTTGTAGAAVGFPILPAVRPGVARAQVGNTTGNWRQAIAAWAAKQLNKKAPEAAPAVAPAVPQLISTGVASTNSSTSLVSIPGPNDSRGVQARATASIAGADVLSGPGGPPLIHIDVAGQPSLTATATGNKATSSLVFVPPAVTLTIDAGPGLVVTVPLSIKPVMLDLGGETLSIALGSLINAVNTGTVVSGEASLLTVSFAGQLNAAFAVEPMVVRATAPRTGIQCTTPAPAPTTSTPTTGTGTGTGEPPLANTGATTRPVGLLGLAALLLGAGILVLSRRARTYNH
ncbi:MAG: hypothetical protein ACR2KJ_19085 [Jatrophihabitans sp.]